MCLFVYKLFVHTQYPIASHWWLIHRATPGLLAARRTRQNAGRHSCLSQMPGPAAVPPDQPAALLARLALLSLEVRYR